MPKPQIRQLPLSALIVDPNLQRALDRARAAKIAEDLDINAVGIITVSRRVNGSYHVIDGQHRVEALRLAGGDIEMVQCRIFEGLTVEDEARLFRLLNNTTRLQAIDKYKVRVVEGEPVAVFINDALARHGWKVDTFGKQASFSAVAAAERVFLRDRAAVERTIVTLTRAFGHDPNGMDGRVFEGVGLVYARYGQAVEDSDLVDRLARYPGGPGRLLGNARGVKDMLRTTVVSAVAEIIVETYNMRRKTKALPAWRAQ